jgi:O-antigen/teichoic acid export membrane protein
MAESAEQISVGWRWRSALSQAAVVFMGYGLIALLGMGALRLYTELAPKSVFGQSNLVVTLLTLGIQLFVAPFTNTQLRYYTEAQARGDGDAFTRETLSWAVRAAAALGILAFIVCLLCGLVGGPKFGFAVATCALAWVLATATRNVLMGRLQAQRRRVVYTSLQVAEAAMLGVATAATLYFCATTEFYLVGQVLGAAAFLVLVLRFSPWPLRKDAPGASLSATGFRDKAVTYGLPFAPIAIVGWLSNLADRYVLGIVLGTAAVGQYVAPLSIASRAMILAGGALSDLFRPSLFDAENRQQRGRATRVFASWLMFNAAIACTAVIVIAVAGDLFVQLLLGKSYREGAVHIMVWIASGYGVYGLTQVLETRLLSLGRSAQLLVPMAAGAAANIAFSILLVPRHGIIGAAQASCLSFVAQCVVTAFFVIAALRRRHATLGAPAHAEEH